MKQSLSRAFLSLRHRNYRFYWFGQMISLLGTSMQTVGLTWLVLQLTHSAWQLGVLGALQALPILVFSLFGGIFADRWPKRRLLLIIQTISLLQALLLWILATTNMLQIWHIYTLALLLGLMNSLGRPIGRTFTSEMVGREDLPNAVALNSLLSQITRIIGPGLAGIIIAENGTSLLFLYNALSFLAVMLGLIMMRERDLFLADPPPPSSTQQSFWHSLREGLNYSWESPTIRLIILIAGLMLLFGSNFNVVLPLFSTTILHAGSTGFGFLSAAFSIGALLSALWIAWYNQKPGTRTILSVMLAFSLLEAFFALSHIYIVSILLIAGVGLTEMTFASQAMIMLQTIVPDHLRGRVISVQVIFFDGSLPLGYLLLGWLSGLYGVALALFISALLCLLTVGTGWLMNYSSHRKGAF